MTMASTEGLPKPRESLTPILHRVDRTDNITAGDCHLATEASGLICGQPSSKLMTRFDSLHPHRAAKAATQTIPIGFMQAADPVRICPRFKAS
jgi:hypothetical protein